MRLSKILESYLGIEILGNNEFNARTKLALDLLGSTDYLSVVQCHVKLIKSGKRSGAWAWLKKPTFEVGIGTWQSSTQWYASAIVHDAIHCKLYRDNKRKFLFIDLTNDDCWRGTQAEVICLHAQLDALKQMDAARELIEHTLRAIENGPVYHKVPYRSRDW